MPQYEWIADPKSLTDLIDHLLTQDAYGIDTEFHRERTYYPQLALVQLSWAKGIALVDPLATPIKSLGRLLQGPGLCVIHAPSQDLEIFHAECHAVPSRLFDTQIAGLFLGLGNASLGKLVEHFLDLRLDKGAQLTDWMQRPLGKRALDYAATDVAHLLELYDAMSHRLNEAGRSGWAADEMEVMRAKDRSPQPPNRAWWKLRGKGKIRSGSQGIAQSLAQWREEKARATDRPPRHVLSDVALVALIQQPPKNRDALFRTRGVDKRHASQADEILEAITRGRSLPASAIDQPPRPRGSIAKPLVSLCLAYVQQRADEESIDSAVLATRSDVETFVASQTGRLAQGWRRELLGAELSGVILGKKAIVATSEGRLEAIANPIP